MNLSDCRRRSSLCILTTGIALAAALSAGPAAAAPQTYQNPVLPGFYSDPSACRVGNDYYLVHSTFGYFPGVPIFHSTNLVNWRQVGNVLDRPSQVPLAKAGITLGIFAPTLRCHGGKFYMITTNITDRGNFFVVADDPRGPWSEPVPVDIAGIDPSLYFDDDGKTYVTSTSNWGEQRDGILLAEIDVKTGKLLTTPRPIWTGTGGRYPEGPHIYKKDGWYYLMIAEGGTEFGHKVTIARAPKVGGPYLANPGNPIMTHADRNAETREFQGVGHGDLVQTTQGDWFMLAHAFREHHSHQVLGRETVLAPVRWDKNAWPVVNGDGTIAASMQADRLPGLVEPQVFDMEDGFDGKALRLEWNYLNNPVTANYSLSSRPGYLRLQGAAATLHAAQQLTFVGRRQQHHKAEAIAQLEFDPRAEGDEAGITAFKDDKHHYALAIVKRNDQRSVELRYRLGAIAHVERSIALQPGPVRLRITSDKDHYAFSAAQGNGGWTELGKADTRYLSSVTAGGFSGTYFGLYASGNGKPAQAPADVDWFRYRGLD